MLQWQATRRRRTLASLVIECGSYPDQRTQDRATEPFSQLVLWRHGGLPWHYVIKRFVELVRSVSTSALPEMANQGFSQGVRSFSTFSTEGLELAIPVVWRIADGYSACRLGEQ